MRGNPPDNWLERLPDPARYYAQHVQKLGSPNADGWARGICPFHGDTSAGALLSVHVTNKYGRWRCSASCGSGDMVTFHMRWHGRGLKAAVRELICWEAL